MTGNQVFLSQLARDAEIRKTAKINFFMIFMLQCSMLVLFFSSKTRLAGNYAVGELSYKTKSRKASTSKRLKASGLKII